MKINLTNPFLSRIMILFMLLISQAGKGASMIRAQIFSLPNDVEISSVTTAGHYILAAHLVRSLTKLDKFGRIQPDVATSWKSKDNKTWKINLGKEKFSNGEPITPEDVVRSIQRQIKIGAGVHFSFSEIRSVKVVDSSSLEVILKNKTNDFIYDLGKPEFGILYKNDQTAEKGALKLAVTSGAYYLLEKTNSKFLLKRNSYFKSDANNDLDLTIENAEGEKSYRELLSRKIDFFTSQQNLTVTKHQTLISTTGINSTKPHVAFTYWLSINPSSSCFKDRKNRFLLQTYVDSFTSTELQEPFWGKANQIYLPDGDGRPSDDELNKTWQQIKVVKNSLSTEKIKLRIVPLKMTNRLLEDLLSYLGKRFDIQILSYNSEDELQKILRSEKFDIKISANDFSSIDLSENLKTTFNSSRPYVFLDHGSPIPDYLSKATQTDDRTKRSELFKKIGLTLLQEGLIAPVAYQRAWFYGLDRIDTSAWSKNYPEISFWKVRVHD